MVVVCHSSLIEEDALRHGAEVLKFRTPGAERARVEHLLLAEYLELQFLYKAIRGFYPDLWR